MTPDSVTRIVKNAVDLLDRYPDCTVAAALRLAAYEDEFFYGAEELKPVGLLKATVSERVRGA